MTDDQLINSPVVGYYLHGCEAFPGRYPQVFDGLRDCCNFLEILELKSQSQSSVICLFPILGT